jgi:phosphomethylpyrimidine synthase
VHTEVFRKYAAEQGIAGEEALKKGMEERNRECQEKGAEIYTKAARLLKLQNEHVGSGFAATCATASVWPSSRAPTAGGRFLPTWAATPSKR